MFGLARALHGSTRDLRHALRAVRRNPAYALTAVAILALGIGVNATIYTIAYSVLLKGFAGVERNDRLLYVSLFANSGAGYADFEDWRAQAQSFQSLALVHGVQRAYSDSAGFAETYYTTEVTAGTFALVGQEPFIGRDFAPDDEVPGAAPVAILAHDFWQRRYAGDPEVVGTAVRVNGVPTTIVGVMPAGFSFPQNQDLWVPLVPTPEVRERTNRNNWFVVGRLRDGATIDSARAEMTAIGRRMQSAYPAENRDLLPRVQTFAEFFIGRNAMSIYAALLGAVSLVLLIACANLASLLLARSLARWREIAVRVSLGASRWRVARQLLVESLLLATLGGLAGWWVAALGVRVFAALAAGPSVSDTIGGSWFDGIIDYSMDRTVLVYLTAIALGAGVLFGVAPAAKLANLDVNAALKDGARAATRGTHGKRLSAALVAAEMALAIVLLAGAGVMIRSFLNIYTADIGARTDNLLATALNLPEARYPDADARLAFFAELTAQVAALPGVTAVGLANSLPTQGVRQRPYELGGLTESADARPTVATMTASPTYFRALGTALRAGREFDERDRADGAPVAIVNERFANERWPGAEPLGQRLRLFDGAAAGDWRTVVGVAPNIAQNDNTRQRLDSIVYVPYSQAPAQTMWVIVQTTVPPATLATPFQRAVQMLDPALPMALGPVVIDDYLAWNYQYRGASGTLFMTCALLGLGLAALGLYAVVAYSVRERTQELGVRIAVGANARDVLVLVFREGMRPVGVGLAIGVIAAYGVNRLLESLLVQTSPADPLALGLACAALLAAAALGCWLPARQALRLDPVVALRQD